MLGSGFEVISVGKRKLVRSVPTELNRDHNEILELAQVTTISYFNFSFKIEYMFFSFQRSSIYCMNIYVPLTDMLKLFHWT